MASLVAKLLGSFKRRSKSPTKSIGVPGTAIYGGYVVENEKNQDLIGRQRYIEFSEIFVNTPIVGAGVRYFINLCGSATWTVKPSENDTDGKFAELAKQCIMKDPKTSFPKTVRRSAMYRFYGFSILEWTARRREDGVMTFVDFAPRAQETIEQWDRNEEGDIDSFVQVDPQDGASIEIPRQRCAYLVEDTYNDSPTGLGLFRHLVEPTKRLRRYEQLEGFGFEHDLRGIPIGRAPYAALRLAVDNEDITEEQAAKAVAAVEGFVENHVRRPDQGLLLDSAVYETQDSEATPSSQQQFGMDLLKGGQTSLPEMANSITRINKEIARILNVESIILGDGDAGSHALSEDKTDQLSLVVDDTLAEISDVFERDFLVVLWQLNGWPEDMMPELVPEAAQYRDIEQITGAIRDLALSGVMLDPNDPIIADIRTLLGVSQALVVEGGEEDASLRDPVSGNGERKQEGSVDNPEEDTPTDAANQQGES